MMAGQQDPVTNQSLWIPGTIQKNADKSWIYTTYKGTGKNIV